MGIYRTLITLFVVFYLGTFQVIGQTESIDSLDINSKKFKVGEYIIPSSMMAYGYVSLFSQKVRSFDYTVQEKLSSDKKFSLDDYLIFGPLVSHGILEIAGIKSENTLADQIGLYGLSTALNALLVYPVKRLTVRERPDGSDLHSFPSGHTSNAFVGAEFFWQEHKTNSPILALVGYFMATATGYLRIYNNKHWMSDVLTGAGTGIVSTKLVYYLYPKIRKHIFKDHENITAAPFAHSGFAGVFISVRLE